MSPGPLEGLKIRGCHYYLVEIICPPPVEIGLTDLPKSGGAMAPPAPLGMTPLISHQLIRAGIESFAVRDPCSHITRNLKIENS